MYIRNLCKLHRQRLCDSDYHVRQVNEGIVNRNDIHSFLQCNSHHKATNAAKSTTDCAGSLANETLFHPSLYVLHTSFNNTTKSYKKASYC